MKKGLTWLLIICMLVSLCACGGEKTESTGAAPKEESAQTAETGSDSAETSEEGITLRMCWWGNENRHEKTLKALELYHEKNPNVTIIGEFIGWEGYLEKLTTQLAAGTAPDIIQIDPSWFLQFWDIQDKFVDMNSQEVIDMTQFDDISSMIEAYTSPEGKLIGLPSGLNYTALYVNGDLAEEIGLDLSTPYTWEKLEADGKKVQEYDENMYLVAPDPVGVEFYSFATYLINLSGDYLVRDDYTLGFTEAQAQETFEWLKRMYDEKVFQPFEETLTLSTVWENPGLLNKYVVMAQQQISNLETARSTLPNCKVVPAYANSDADVTGLSLRPTNFYSVPTASKYTEEALKVIDFLYNDEEALEILGTCRSMPVTAKSTKVLEEKNLIDEDQVGLLEFVKEHKGGSGINVFSINSEFINLEFDEFSKLYYGECTAEEAAKEFTTLVQKKAEELKGS